MKGNSHAFAPIGTGSLETKQIQAIFFSKCRKEVFEREIDGKLFKCFLFLILWVMEGLISINLSKIFGG